ncbi:hypothetical protein Cgig2_012372 [Carnegiea gigantea]|uniref:Uncharacterized protein n=1 Tax=Carnegiea gigantea TaxID=171969 RepID=A0A9Q1KNH4_9CARY|nr:hypothetical protein Cgig2_012372 [Carnegiea gigantea]
MVEKGACMIYGRYSHEESVCYEVIRYPPGWGNCTRGRGQRGGRNNRGCRGASRGRGHLAYPAQQQRMEDAGGRLDEALGPLEALAHNLLPPREHKDRGSRSQSSVEYVDRGSPVAQQRQPDPHEGGTTTAQDGEEPSAPNAITGPINPKETQARKPLAAS